MWEAISSNANDKFTRDAGSNAWLSTVTYRSRATSLLSDSELQELVQVAQARNRSESITGMVVYDNGRFFQWLEGPGDALSRVMDSIRHDFRHTDIEILGAEKTPVRIFNGWDLKLKKKPLNESPTISVSRVAQIQGTVGQPEATKIEAPVSPGSPEGIAKNISTQISSTKPDSVHLGIHPTEIDSRAYELARLLIAPDPADASRLIDELAEQAGTSKALFAIFLEPAARSLGDLWSEDFCTEFDVTIGLCHLQSAMRRINYRFVRASMPSLDARSVLVAPQPGELHMLCAALNSEVLWQAGWNTRCEFPSTDHALQDLLSKDWFDALDLSLSASFRREHWLPRITKTISAAREASCNPALAVVIGGRLFSEQPDIGDSVGADACVDSSIYAVETISRAFGKRGQPHRKPPLPRNKDLASRSSGAV